MDSDELLAEEDLIKPNPASLKSKERECLHVSELPLVHTCLHTGECGSSGKKKACKNW